MSFSSLSPELLPSKPALEAGTDIYHALVVAVVVDEAHCVTEWYIAMHTDCM